MSDGVTSCGAVAPSPIAVLKFGSSILDAPAGFHRAAETVAAELQAGRRALVVVSAMRGVTDRLGGIAEGIVERPPRAWMAALLATGEEASVALLCMALAAIGVDADGVDARGLGLRTGGALDDAEPIAVALPEIRQRLSVCRAVVVPGFVGRDALGAPSVLGRGGSDLTALFMARQLGASRVRLIKDVDGVYPADPKLKPSLLPLAEVSWSEAARLGGGVVQPKALDFAREHDLEFVVCAPRGRGTRVGRTAPVEVPT